VTGDNRLLYVHLLADHLLNTRLGRATAAFAGGVLADVTSNCTQRLPCTLSCCDEPESGAPPAQLGHSC
jgi:hypothetical protein